MQNCTSCNAEMTKPGCLKTLATAVQVYILTAMRLIAKLNCIFVSNARMKPETVTRPYKVNSLVLVNNYLFFQTKFASEFSFTCILVK